MPIYEYYCPENNTIYQFYAKTLAQGQTTPSCPDNLAFRLERIFSSFAISGGEKKSMRESADPETTSSSNSAEDARMEAAMGAMEQEFSSVDENDPRAMARMMRRMSEVTGEKIDGEMEEVVRKLEEGADPDSLEDEFGGAEGDGEMDGGEMPGGFGQAAAGDIEKEKKHHFRVPRRQPRRDPQLYDYS